MKAQHRDLTCVYSGTAIALADDHRGYSKLELLDARSFLNGKYISRVCGFDFV